MILTCPKCATRYLVDDGEMRPEGRKVKCGSCGEEWRVSPGADLDPPLIAAAAEPSLPTQEFAPARGTTAIIAPEPPVLESLFVSPITTDSKPTASKRSTLGANLMLLVVVLAVLAVAGYGFRMEIVRIAPKAAGIYTALGVPMTPQTPIQTAPPPQAKPPPPAAAASHG